MQGLDEGTVGISGVLDIEISQQVANWHQGLVRLLIARTMQRDSIGDTTVFCFAVVLQRVSNGLQQIFAEGKVTGTGSQPVEIIARETCKRYINGALSVENDLSVRCFAAARGEDILRVFGRELHFRCPPYDGPAS